MGGGRVQGSGTTEPAGPLYNIQKQNLHYGAPDLIHARGTFSCVDFMHDVILGESIGLRRAYTALSG